MTTLPAPALPGNVEGGYCRDRAHNILHARRPELIRRVQRTFISHLLMHGPATIDPIRDRVPLPAGTDPRLVGAAVRGLALDGLIIAIGSEKSRRPLAHARKVDRWALCDDEAAIAWLKANPDFCEPNVSTPFD